MITRKPGDKSDVEKIKEQIEKKPEPFLAAEDDPAEENLYTGEPAEKDEESSHEDTPATPKALCFACAGTVDEGDSFCRHCSFDLQAEDLWKEIKLTRNDISAYIFSGFVRKRLVIVPGFLEVILQTLTNAQLSVVGDEVSLYLQGMKQFTPDQREFKRSRSLVGQAVHAIITIDEEGKEDRKALTTDEDRKMFIENLGSDVFNILVQKYNDLQKAVLAYVRNVGNLKNS